MWATPLLVLKADVNARCLLDLVFPFTETNYAWCKLDIWGTHTRTFTLNHAQEFVNVH